MLRDPPPFTAETRAESEAAGTSASDADLWRDVAGATDPGAFARAWLGIVARSYPAIMEGAVLYAAKDGGRLEPVARWARSRADADRDRIKASGEDVLAAALESRQPAITGADAEGAVLAGLPVVVDEAVRGAVLVAANAPEQARARQLMRHLQWGSAWFENFIRRSSAATDSGAGERAARLVDTVNAVVSAPTFDAASWTFLNRLAALFGCERAALGRRRRLHTRLISVLQASAADRRNEAARAIEAAMDEAIDQRAPLAVPAPAHGLAIAAAHEALARTEGASAVLTVPLSRDDTVFGAVTLEHFSGGTFSEADIALADALAAACAPVLMDKYAGDRGLAHIAVGRLGRLARGRVRPGQLIAAGVVLVLVGGIAAAAFATETYRVQARAVIEGEVRRVVSAPYDGYLAAQRVRAGDVVHAGDVLAEMNDGDLKLEKLRHVAERHQHELELDKALGEGNLAAVNIARAQIAEKDAEIELADAMLERAMMRAPFDGLVTAGDLSHSVGLPVGRGDALFELAPLDRYRVSMVVDEADVDSVRPGAAGELLLTALPEHPFRVTVKSVTPVARAAEGINGFEVVAMPEETDPRFRPAMEGIAKIEVGERTLLWMWTHKLVARARILVWGVLP